MQSQIIAATRQPLLIRHLNYRGKCQYFFIFFYFSSFSNSFTFNLELKKTIYIHTYIHIGNRIILPPLSINYKRDATSHLPLSNSNQLILKKKKFTLLSSFSFYFSFFNSQLYRDRSTSTYTTT